MHKKRIAYFIESDALGGAETLILSLCRFVISQNFAPIIIHNNNNYLVDQCKRYNIEQVNVPHYHLFKSTKLLPIFAWKFRKYLKDKNIDILHSHLFGPITGAAAAAKFANIPHVGTLHDIYMIENKPLRIKLIKLAALLNTKLITVSNTMEQFYRQRANFKKNQLSTIYNGVDCKFPTENNTQLIRQSIGLKPNTCVIANVGRLVSLKRHDLLLKALAEIDIEIPWQMLIVGDGPERQHIEDLVIQYQLTDRVVLCGKRDDVADLLTAADLFVQCSDTEGLSMSIMEAMAVGLPAVVTDVGGNHELISNNENGFLVPPNSSEALAGKLTQLISSNKLRKQMQDKTFAIVAEKFNIETTFQNYLNLYQVLDK